MANKYIKSFNFGDGNNYFPLPFVSAADNGKVLMVSGGNWGAGVVSGGNSGNTTKAAGLYDADGVMLASWDELVNTYGLDIEKDFENGWSEEPGKLIYICRNNDGLRSGVAQGCELIIPDTVTKIGSCLSSFPYLTSVTIPSSVVTIGEAAFCNVEGLTSINIPDSVTSIGNHAFYYCYGLTSATISNNINSIGDYVFGNCSFTSINIPDSVESIGEHAFRQCLITSVTIPDSVKSIGREAFSECNELTSVYFEHITPPIFNYKCFGYSAAKRTYYFKNSVVADAFVDGTHYETSYGTKSTNYNW